MTKIEILNALHTLHDPELRNCAMVYQVWEDGEVTLQKGGSLFGQRSLHMIELPVTGGTGAIPVQSMPAVQQSGLHGYLFAENEAATLTARDLIRKYEGAE